MTDSITFVLPSTFETIERIVDESETFFRRYFTDEEHLYKLQLLASEAVTNGIEHGNAHDESKTVTVIFGVAGDDASISVEDEGTGFDREAVSDPMAESNLLEDGGRGLFLMESMADEVRYDNGGRRVTLVVRNTSH